MINKFLIGPIALALCFVIALSADAQDATTPEKKALIKELMKLLNAPTNAEAVASQFMEQLRKPYATLISQEVLREISQRKLSPGEQRRLKSEGDEVAQRLLVRVRAEFPKRINLEELLDRVGLEMYGKHFTEEELKELVTIYKSPAMQKFVRLLPQI